MELSYLYLDVLCFFDTAVRSSSHCIRAHDAIPAIAPSNVIRYPFI